MNETLQLTHTRVGDIPLLLGLMIKLGMPEIYDQEIGDHGLHTGLRGGWMLTIWLVFILTESDHTKYKVEDWVARQAALFAQQGGYYLTVAPIKGEFQKALPAWIEAAVLGAQPLTTLRKENGELLVPEIAITDLFKRNKFPDPTLNADLFDDSDTLLRPLQALVTREAESELYLCMARLLGVYFSNFTDTKRRAPLANCCR